MLVCLFVFSPGLHLRLIESEYIRVRFFTHSVYVFPNVCSVFTSLEKFSVVHVLVQLSQALEDFLSPQANGKMLLLYVVIGLDRI